jgi:hypothetical protein
MKKAKEKIWNFEEETYMNIPKDNNAEKNATLETAMALKWANQLSIWYRHWHKRFDEETINLGFKWNKLDPYLYAKMGSKPCIHLLYVNDGVMRI